MKPEMLQSNVDEGNELIQRSQTIIAVLRALKGVNIPPPSPSHHVGNQKLIFFLSAEGQINCHPKDLKTAIFSL